MCMIFFVVCLSCSKDVCSGVVCQNGGTCFGGSCQCTDSYSGDRCQYTAVGNLTFFTEWDTLGIITVIINGVNINGMKGYITSYAPFGLDYCGENGCANFSLPVGIYTYSANSTSGHHWGTDVDGINIKVTKGGCNKFKLK